jgi:GTP-binding protein HflX
VDRVLEEIGAGATRRIIVMNKIDLVEHSPRIPANAEAISALRSLGLERLLERIGRELGITRQEIAVTIAANRGDLIAMARREGEVLSEEYRDGVVAMRARVSPPVAGRLRKANLAEA